MVNGLTGNQVLGNAGLQVRVLSSPLNVACAPFRFFRVNLRSVYRYNTVTCEALEELVPKNFAKHLHSSENRNILHRSVVQLVECRSPKPEVVGSNPA